MGGRTKPWLLQTHQAFTNPRGNLVCTLFLARKSFQHTSLFLVDANMGEERVMKALIAVSIRPAENPFCFFCGCVWAQLDCTSTTWPCHFPLRVPCVRPNPLSKMR